MDTQSTAAARQAQAADLLNALGALDYAIVHLADKTPPNADAARRHLQSHDWLLHFRARVEQDYRALMAATPIAEAAQAVAATAPPQPAPAIDPPRRAA